MMFVTTWIAVTGLLAMSIPIIIHLLFRKKRKPVEWGAMRLLIEAVNRNKKRSRIENILLLTIRCLILLLVGLALAEPLLSGARLIGSSSKHIIMIVDDGVLSGIRSKESGDFELDTTIDSGIRLINELSVGDRVSLISAGNPVEEITDGPTIDHQRVISILESLTPGNGSTNVSQAVQLASTIANEQDINSDPTVILMGEWRRGSLGKNTDSISVPDSAKIRSSEGNQTNLIATEPAIDQSSVLAIESISVRRPVNKSSDDRPEICSTISINRLGNDLNQQNTTIRLVGEGIEETLPQPITFSPGSTRSIIEINGRVDSTTSAIDGTSTMSVSIDDQSLLAASIASVTIDTSPRIRIGIVDRENFTVTGSVNEVSSSQWIEKALEPNAGGQIQVDFIDPISINQRSVSEMDGLVIVRPDLVRESGWEVLRSARDSGLFILFIPPGNEDVHDWIDVFSDRFELDLKSQLGVSVFDTPKSMASSQPGGSLIHQIDSDINDLVSPVDIYRMIKVDISESDPRVPLVMESDDPFLLVWEPTSESRGVLALLLVSPEIRWTSLPIKPLMVPLFQELIRQGKASSNISVQVLSGELQPIPVPGAREIRHPSGVSIKIDPKGVPESPPRQLGTWKVLDSSGNTLSNIVVNVDRYSIDPSLVQTDQLEKWLSTSGEWSVMDTNDILDSVINSKRESSSSIFLLLIALALLVLETGLNRKFSHLRLQRKTPDTSGVSFS